MGEYDFYCSRSWAKYGYTESAFEGLRDSWLTFMEKHLMTECPVKGIFPDKSSACADPSGLPGKAKPSGAASSSGSAFPAAKDVKKA